MSKIRIYSKKAFAFGPGADRYGNIDMFVTVPRSFQEMDEKYTADPTYKMAVVCGDVIPYPAETVIHGASVETVKQGESDTAENDTAERDTVEEFSEKLKIASKSEVKKLAEQYGAEFVETDSIRQNRKRVLEAYKLSIGE